MDRIFLDANVLFSAAYRFDSPIRRLWELPDAELWSSKYAADETLRNLQERRPERVEELHRLLAQVHCVLPSAGSVPSGVSLAGKDLPILLAAIAGGATHLLTGDKAHFGLYYGESVGGVRILPPVEYLRGHE